jgi:hypothetical protein
LVSSPALCDVAPLPGIMPITVAGAGMEPHDVWISAQLAQPVEALICHPTLASIVKPDDGLSGYVLPVAVESQA